MHLVIPHGRDRGREWPQTVTSSDFGSFFFKSLPCRFHLPGRRPKRSSSFLSAGRDGSMEEVFASDFRLKSSKHITSFAAGLTVLRTAARRRETHRVGKEPHLCPRLCPAGNSPPQILAPTRQEARRHGSVIDSKRTQIFITLVLSLDTIKDII